MTQFITQSDQVGTLDIPGGGRAIPNEFATAGLDTAILVDPVKIQAFKASIASQMNAQSGGPTFEDLSERIADVDWQTAAQGAGILKVGIIDPLWVLPMSGFIQVFDDGYLAPIDINFPTGTNCWWRLCQLNMVWDAEMGSEANITLTFEDRIASLLRQVSPATGGISQGQPNQTLGGFIKQIVDSANHLLKLKGKDKIQLVELIDPQDPNYTVPITTLPQNPEGSLKNPARPDPAKQKKGPTADQLAELKSIQDGVISLFNGLKSVSLGQLESKGQQLQNQGLIATGPGSDLLTPGRNGLVATGVEG